MATVKKAKPKPKPKPKVKAVKAKKAAAPKKPAPAVKGLAELKARLDALEGKGKVDNSDKIKQLEEKIAGTNAEMLKLKHDMAAWEHKMDRKLDLLHDTIQGVSGKVELLMSKEEALEQAVATSPPSGTDN